jgi:HTH-type transcriptional regulator/antitoxin HipB
VLARTPEDIGLLIRDQRLKLGLDQRSLAERVGVSRQWIVEVERGKPRAEVGLILRTLAALELQIDIGGAGLKRTAQPVKGGARPRARIDLNAVIDRARGKKG